MCPITLFTKNTKCLSLACIVLCSNAATAGTYDVSQIGIHLGYRKDDLKWNIASNMEGADPNILSELKYTDMETIQGTLYWRNYSSNQIYFTADVGFGTIVDGDARDSDYLLDDRTLEISRSYADVTGDTTFDGLIGIGYQFGNKFDFINGNGWTIIPMIGYSLHKQEIQVENGNHIINLISSDLGEFDNLDSSYDTEWKGPFLGLRTEYDRSKDFGAYLELRYHHANYDADADWNLRTDFAHPTSFDHNADANGHVAIAGIRFKPTKGLRFEIALSYQKWKTEKGEDNTYFSDGTSLSTQLNEVTWDSTSIMFSPIYEF